MIRVFLAGMVVLLWGAAGVKAGLAGDYNLAIASMFIVLCIGTVENQFSLLSGQKRLIAKQRELIDAQRELLCSRKETHE